MWTVQCFVLALLLHLFNLQTLGSVSLPSPPLTTSTANQKPNNTENVTRLVETPDGCPLFYDFGKLGYTYKRPAICDSLFPAHVPQFTKHQSTLPPFRIVFTPTTESDAFYNLIIGVKKGFNVTIAGVVIKLEKIKPNGKVTLDTHAGHLEASPVAGNAYCCSSQTKYNSLLEIFQNDTKLRQRRLTMHWYPMNFGVGKLKIKANVFAEEKVYWTFRNLEFPVPMLLTNLTGSTENPWAD